jgi:hypothetical protein
MLVEPPLSSFVLLQAMQQRLVLTGKPRHPAMRVSIPQPASLVLDAPVQCALQIDDLFLDTGEPFVTTNSYRMTVADSQALATFAANVPSLPAGSSFRVRDLKSSITLHAAHHLRL